MFLKPSNLLSFRGMVRQVYALFDQLPKHQSSALNFVLYPCPTSLFLGVVTAHRARGARPRRTNPPQETLDRQTQPQENNPNEGGYSPRNSGSETRHEL